MEIRSLIKSLSKDKQLWLKESYERVGEPAGLSQTQWVKCCMDNWIDQMIHEDKSIVKTRKVKTKQGKIIEIPEVNADGSTFEVFDDPINL